MTTIDKRLELLEKRVCAKISSVKNSIKYDINGKFDNLTNNLVFTHGMKKLDDGKPLDFAALGITVPIETEEEFATLNNILQANDEKAKIIVSISSI